MASCTKDVATPVPLPVEYHLVLNQDEADFMAKMMDCQEWADGEGGQIAEGVYFALSHTGARLSKWTKAPGDRMLHLRRQDL